MNVTPPTPEHPLAIRSTLLRSVLLVELDDAAGLEVTVKQLCAALERRGFTVRGRPSKVVSDALRVELVKGRAYRTGRGRYRIGTLPRTTRWRCHQRLRDAAAGRVLAIHLARPGRERPMAAIREGLERVQLGPHGAVVARRRNAPTYEARYPRQPGQVRPLAHEAHHDGALARRYRRTADPPDPPT